MHSPSPVIQLEQLHKRYRSGLFGKPVEALCGVSFAVEPGQIFGLLGPNGAGKTTIIKILLGIIGRTSGSATLLDFPAGDRRGRRQVGYLPERLRLSPHQTARTALQFYGQLSGMSSAAVTRRSDELLSLVGLSGRDRESVRRYSKGMQQRLALAQAMLHDPEVLILDEPTDGLDPVGRSQVRTALQTVRDAGKTVFLNSHLLQEVEMVCDHVAILNEGRLRFEGTIQSLTPDGSGQVAVVVTGDEHQVHSVVAGQQAINCRPLDERRWELTLDKADQSVVDHLVDQLRQSELSITRLNWKRKTLEDAFLQLVASPRPPSNPPQETVPVEAVIVPDADIL